MREASISADSSGEIGSTVRNSAAPARNWATTDRKVPTEAETMDRPLIFLP